MSAAIRSVTEASSPRSGFEWTSWAMRQCNGLSLSVKMTLITLANHADADGRSFPSIACIAREGCLSERSCQNAIPQLEALGLIKVDRKTGRGHTSIYTLQFSHAAGDTKGAVVAPFVGVERVQTLHPLSRERVQIVQLKGAAIAPQQTIEQTSSAAPTKLPRKKRLARPKNPCRSAPPKAWAHLADQHRDGSPKLETDPRAGDDFGRPIVGGSYLDEAARMVCDAAGFTDPGWAGNWEPLIAWLRDGFDLRCTILPAINRVANRPSYPAPSSLKYFDRAVREVAPALYGVQRTQRANLRGLLDL